jgi:hypothetical protein
LGRVKCSLGIDKENNLKTNTLKYFLGLHRHEWADIHLYLAFLLLPLLVFHVWFNWTWVIQSTKRYLGDHWKNFLRAISFAWIIVLIVGWFAVRF